MKKMRLCADLQKFFLLLIFLSPNLLVYSNLSSELIIEIDKTQDKNEFYINDVEEKADYVFFYKFPTAITQYIFVEEYYKNSLSLIIENPSSWSFMFNSLFYHDLKVTIDYLKDSQFNDADYSFDGKEMLINNIKPNSIIKIEYRYQSDFILKNNPSACYFIQPNMYFWQSWYFTHPEIKLKDISFKVTDDAYFFANLPIVGSGKEIKLDCSFIKQNDVSYYLLDKNFYKKNTLNYKNNIINLFLTDNVSIDTVKTLVDGSYKEKVIISNGSRVNNELLIQTSDELSKTMYKIDEIFDQNNKKVINIADAYLSIEDDSENIFTWGNLTKSHDDSYLVLIDTSFWKTHSLAHELTHIFNNHGITENEKEFYFFDESLTEFISVYIKYENEDLRDSIYLKKKRYYESFPKKDYKRSIFKIRSNQTKLDGSKGGTSFIISEKTPCIIHDFAKSLGYDMFILILKDFYTNINNDQKLSLELLKKSMMNHGVTQEQWNSFYKKL